MTCSWTERYMITSTTGRVYTRSMVLAAFRRDRAACDLRDQYGLRVWSIARRLVDDHAFMKAVRGQVPARVVDHLYWGVFETLTPLILAGTARDVD